MTTPCTVSFAHPTVLEVYNGDSALTDLSFCRKQQPFYSISPAKPWSMLGWMDSFDISLVSSNFDQDIIEYMRDSMRSKTSDTSFSAQMSSAQIYLWLSLLKVPAAPGSFAY